MARTDTGIEVRSTGKGEKRYRAEVWDTSGNFTRSGRPGRVFKTFTTRQAAKAWRAATQVKIASGEAPLRDSPTVAEAWATWYAGALAGHIHNKRGQRYKPSVLQRGYEVSMRRHVLPVLGARKLDTVTRAQVQALVDQMVRSGAAAGTVRNAMQPLRVLYRDAIRRELARINPTTDLALPSGAQARDRIATPAEVEELLGALTHDRVLWALAFYAGLRAGELAALDWSHVDLKRRTITVERSWDAPSRTYGAPKTGSGRRVVPFPPTLLPYLMEARRPEGLVCGDDGVTPFQATTVRKRALKAWGWKIDNRRNTVIGKARPDALEPITLHECRHTFVSLMLGSGIDLVKVSKWVGHSSISITVDRYGHLVPGDETAAMDRFDAYLAGGR